jgi:hypothetical protein
MRNSRFRYNFITSVSKTLKSENIVFWNDGYQTALLKCLTIVILCSLPILSVKNRISLNICHKNTHLVYILS